METVDKCAKTQKFIKRVGIPGILFAGVVFGGGYSIAMYSGIALAVHIVLKKCKNLLALRTVAAGSFMVLLSTIWFAISTNNNDLFFISCIGNAILIMNHLTYDWKLKTPLNAKGYHARTEIKATQINPTTGLPMLRNGSCFDISGTPVGRKRSL